LMSADRADRTVEEETAANDPVLEASGYAPMSIDELAMHTGLGAATLAARLTKLDWKDASRSFPAAGSGAHRVAR